MTKIQPIHNVAWTSCVCWDATGAKNHNDMGHSLFLNSTCDIGENKRQGHETWPFPKIDMRHGDFLNSTCDIGLSDMRQGLKIITTWDIAFS